MRLLLDTHVFHWFRITPEALGRRSMEQLRRREIVISSISSLETAQLVHSGKLILPCDVEAWMLQTMELFGALEGRLTPRIAAEAYRLPGEFHRDPADRVLVATARVEGLTLITADRRILEYPHVQTLDARA